MRTKSGVFISYARSDGSEYAAWLRRKLEKEHPEITLWQDVIRERAGKDWWLQITDALDHVAYMVVVGTPEAMRSDAVEKEWRYARQQGVCVLPVQASDALNFKSLPRWMRTQQFANLKVEAQWELFIGDLHRPRDMPRVPFMAEDLPRDFVARPEEFEPIIRLLIDKAREKRHPVAITTALRGAGGFGKTTLAKAVCHDDRIQEVFDDGVLWITLGEKVENLPGKVAELTFMLNGESRDFGSLEPAVTKLRELLADRDILMVIDDVWDPAHLEPFLQGGLYCARLITTRNLDTLPQQCPDVKVDSMQPAEAAALLGAGLPSECQPEISALAGRLGKWPLLLGIVNGVLRERVNQTYQPLSKAIGYVNKALDKRGLTAFDPGNTKARNRVVELTVNVSLEEFSSDQRDQERFHEMSIFPEDFDIPLNVVATLWQATAGLDEVDAEDLCVRLHRHSLLQTLDLATRHVRLHDVMRIYLQMALTRRTDPKFVHSKFADALGDPHNLSGNYAWRWYAYHMVGAGRVAELRTLLLDPSWLRAKLAAADFTSLTADFERLPGDEDLHLVQGALRLSANAIGTDPSQFGSQIVGRLLPNQDVPAIERFMAQVIEGARTPWLRPLQPTLHASGASLIRTLQGHSDSVHGVAMSADGRLAVSASFDHTLKVWELASGRELRTLTGHESYVTAVAVTPDGQRAVSASGDKTLKVWELASGRELHTLTGHTSYVTAVAVTPDGQRAVSASADRTLKVWELSSGRELRTLHGHSGYVNGVGLSRDGKRAVSASEDNTLKVWDVDSGRALRILEGHSDAVLGVAMSADGRLAISASDDHTLKVWDVESGHNLCTLHGHAGRVLGVATNANGRLAVSASADNTLKVWDVESGRELCTLTGHSYFVYGVAMSADGRLAVSASRDNTLKVWDVESWRELRTLYGHAASVYSVAISADGRRAVSASGDNALKVWNVESGCELVILEGHTSLVNGVAVSADGRFVVSASYDQTLKVWELGSGRELHTLTGHTSLVNGVAVSADGRRAVSASGDNTLKVWDVESGRELRTLEGHSAGVYGVAMSADGRLAVSACSDRTLRVWDVERGRPLRILEGHSDWVCGVAVSADGRRAVSSSSDKTLKVWDVESGCELRTLRGHSFWVRGVAVAGDGRIAVSTSFDHTLKVWNVETGVSLATFTCDGPAYCCAFSDALKLVVAGDALGRVHFLRLEERRAEK